MSAETMMAFLNKCSFDRELGFRIAQHCGPVLKNQKASNIVSVKAGAFAKLWKRFRGSAIRCVPLYSDGEKEVLIFYRHARLERHLKKPENRTFLEECGYTDISVAAVIRQLRIRYAQYAEGSSGFPHELGIVLEYPVKDVAEFIRQGGKGCLMEKYWKVYHNPNEAMETFKRYDMAKEQAMREFIAGRPLHQIAV